MKSIAHKTIIQFIVSLALFMDALDSTIINTAIPTIANSMQVNPVDLKIALISYLVTLAIFIPISGYIADRFGIKRVFITALTIFTIGSWWCGFSKTLEELTIARCVQGLGGALMMPLGRLIILRNFEKHEIVTAMNHVIMVVSLGLMLGPFVGGVISERFSWHWIFLVNIPVGLLNIIAARIWLKDGAIKVTKSFDFLGFILFSSGLALLTLSLANFSQSTANLIETSKKFFVSIILLLSYFLYARRRKNSIINLSLFELRTFRVSILGNLCCRLSFGGIPFLLPLLLQLILHYSAETSGLLLVPIAVGVLFIKTMTFNMLKRLGFRQLLLMNTIFLSFCLWLFMIIDITTSPYMIAILTFIFGGLITIQYSGMNSLAYADIDIDQHSAAISIMSTTQQLSQSFGVATSALILHAFALINFSTITKLNTHTFHQTFFALGLLTLVSTLIFLHLKPNDGKAILARENS